MGVLRLVRLFLLLAISWSLIWCPAVAQVQQKPVVFAPTGGVQTNVPDLARTKEYAKVLDNLHMTRRGVWTTAGTGYDDVSSTGASVLEMGDHFDDSGVHYLVYQTGTALKTLLPNSVDITGGTAPSASFVPCFKSFSPTTFIFVNGDSQPQIWDGVEANNFAVDGAWPVTLGGLTYSKPKFVEVFRNRACFAGFAAGTGQRNFTVLMSKQDNASNFNTTTPTAATDAGAFTLPSALGPITGLKTIRLGNSTNDQALIIGCERGMAFIAGSDARDFSLKEITRSHGCLSNRAWVLIQNDLYYPATDGIRIISNLNTSATLSPDTVTFRVNDLWNRIHYLKRASIFAVQHPSTQEVIWWIPIDDDTACKNALVLNYNTDRNADGTVAPIFSTMSGFGIAACGIDFEGTLYAGHGENPADTTSEYIVKYFYGDEWNTNNEITWTFVSPLIETNPQNPIQSSQTRALLILLDGGSSDVDGTAYNQTFTVDVWGFTSTPTRTTLVSQFASYSIAEFSNTVTDYAETETWGTGNSTIVPHIVEINPPGTARYWQIRMTGETATNNTIYLIGLAHIQNIGGTRQ
jgi:hypothetical protein